MMMMLQVVRILIYYVKKKVHTPEKTLFEPRKRNKHNQILFCHFSVYPSTMQESIHRKPYYQKYDLQNMHYK